MGLTPFTAGQILDDVDLNRLLPVGVVKLADTSRSATTTLAADPELTVAVSANHNYMVYVSIVYQSGTTPDFKWDFSVPAGATFDNYRYLGNTGAGLAHDVIATAGGAASLAGSASNDAMTIWGSLVVGATAGNFVFRWAQNTSDAGATIVRANSFMHLVPIDD